MILLDILYFSNLFITSVRNNLVQVSPYLFTYLQCTDLSDSLISILQTSFYRKILNFKQVNSSDIYTYREINANELEDYSNCLSTRVGASTYPCYIPSVDGENILDIQQEDIDNYNTWVSYIEDNNISNQTLIEMLNQIQTKSFFKVSLYTYAQLNRSNLYCVENITNLPETSTIDIIVKHLFLYKILNSLKDKYVEELP